MSTTPETEKAQAACEPDQVSQAAAEDNAYRAALLVDVLPVYERSGMGKALLNVVFEKIIGETLPDFGGLEIRVNSRAASQRYVSPSASDGEEQYLLDAIESIYADLLADGNQRANRTTIINNKRYALLAVSLRSPKTNETCGGFAMGWSGKTVPELRCLYRKLKVAATLLESLWQQALTARGTTETGPVDTTRSVPAKLETPVGEVSKPNVTSEVADSRPAQETNADKQNEALKQGDETRASRTTSELAMILANNICNRFRCEQVSVAAVDRNSVKTLAVSGCAAVKLNSPGVVAMQQAMGECLDFGSHVSFSFSQNRDAETKFPLHRQWSLSAGGCYVCTVPLESDGKVVALIAVRRNADSPFNADDLKSLKRAVAPFASSVVLSRLAERNLIEHARQDLLTLFHRNSTLSRLSAIVAAVALVSYCLFGTLPYRPLCTARMIPAETRHLSAPFAARLEAICVRPGQEVKKGEPLVRLDTRLLSVELASIESQVRASAVSMRQAMDKGDVDLSATHRAQAESLEAQAELLRKKIALGTLTAPADGTVLSCAVLKREGANLQFGEPVMEFAARGGWNVEVDVPDNVACFVESGQVGSFASYAHPEQAIPITISHINESAVAEEGRSVFKAEAVLHNGDQDMRAGMTGMVRIETARKPVWWVALHGIVDSLRLRFWI